MVKIMRSIALFLLTNDFFKRDDIDLIIELTGNMDIYNDILSKKKKTVRAIANRTAQLFWEISRVSILQKKTDQELKETRARYKMIINELIQAELDPQDPNYQELETITKETLRCRKIVSSLLDFARQSTPARKPCDINDVVNESVVLTHKQAELLVYGNEIRGHLVFKPVAGGNIIARITEDIDVQAFSLGDGGAMLGQLW